MTRQPSPSRRRGAVAVLTVLALLVTAGCANIPEESNPRPVTAHADQPVPPVEGPTKDLEPSSLVREFIGRSGNSEAAALYLTDNALEQWWQESGEPTIIHDVFNAVPERPDQDGAQDTPSESADSEATVALRVTKVGRLDDHSAFVPAIGQSRHEVTLRRNERGQWRIDTPPPAAYIPLQVFKESFRQVTVYFFDPSLRITVPDPRYVPVLPPDGVPDRVMSALLAGPSDTLAETVENPLDGISVRRNVVPDEVDSALVVDLEQVGDKTKEERRLIAAQIVLSLQDDAPNGIRLRGDGESLMPYRDLWRASDIAPYDTLAKPKTNAPALMVTHGQIRTLEHGEAIEGPADYSQYSVENAAQSLDGQQLAVVHRTGAGPRLMVGEYGESLRPVDLEATELSRPTWLVSTSEKVASREVWTVADGKVVRVVRGRDDVWEPLEVNASDLDSFGPITDLRLSRDGTRAALIVDDRVVVASVVREKQDTVLLRKPRRLWEEMVVGAVGIDWLDQETLVVATNQPTLPVANLAVDGSDLKRYSSDNLELPVTAIAAAPDKDVVVTDSVSVSAVTGFDNIWKQLAASPGPDAIPFYPG